MKWTVEVTHPSTGEEMIVRVEAATREQAAACAADGGWLVRDCYQAGRGFVKVLRVLAWIWVAWFGFVGVLQLVLGLGGWVATPTAGGIAEALGGLICAAIAASLGVLVATGSTQTLRQDPPPDPRRGFDVLPREHVPTHRPSAESRTPE